MVWFLICDCCISRPHTLTFLFFASLKEHMSGRNLHKLISPFDIIVPKQYSCGRFANPPRVIFPLTNTPAQIQTCFSHAPFMFLLVVTMLRLQTSAGHIISRVEQDKKVQGNFTRDPVLAICGMATLESIV